MSNTNISIKQQQQQEKQKSQQKIQLTKQYTFEDGSKYSGQIIDGKRNGRGSYLFSNGDQFQGVFKDNQMVFGVLKMRNGYAYEGSFMNNKFFGKGRLFKIGNGTQSQSFTSNNQIQIYSGQWKNSMKDGQGIMKYSPEQFYQGNFSQNKKQGYGVYIYNNLQRYQGNWVNDLKHGTGTLILDQSKNQYLQGRWQNNQFVQGTFSYYNQDIYQGELKNGMRHGHGKYIYRQGGVYQGQWDSNQKHGAGNYTYPNHDFYQGMFLKNQKVDNQGVYVWNSRQEKPRVENLQVSGNRIISGDFHQNQSDKKGRHFIN